MFIFPIIKFHQKTISLNGNRSWLLTNENEHGHSLVLFAWLVLCLCLCLIRYLTFSLPDQFFVFVWSVLCICRRLTRYLSKLWLTFLLLNLADKIHSGHRCTFNYIIPNCHSTKQTQNCTFAKLTSYKLLSTTLTWTVT